MEDVPEEMLESKDDNLTVKKQAEPKHYKGRFEIYTFQYRRRSPTSVKDNIVRHLYTISARVVNSCAVYT